MNNLPPQYAQSSAHGSCQNASAEVNVTFQIFFTRPQYTDAVEGRLIPSSVFGLGRRFPNTPPSTINPMSSPLDRPAVKMSPSLAVSLSKWIAFENAIFAKLDDGLTDSHMT